MAISGTAYAKLNIPDSTMTDLLTKGQDPPIVTGTVHLPQGGTRPSKAAVIAGQEYLEGAKEPTDIVDEMQRKLATIAPAEIKDAFMSGDIQTAKPLLTGLVQTSGVDIGQAYPENDDEAIAWQQWIQQVSVEVGADITKDELISRAKEEVLSYLKGGMQK